MAGPLIAVTESEEQPAGAYFAAVEAAGGKVLRLDVNKPVDVEHTLRMIDGLLLTGGADVHPSWYGEEIDPKAGVKPHPNRDDNELPLARAAMERDMPVLGICRGMQAINVLLGGKLVQDLPGHSPIAPATKMQHEIFIPPGSRMTTILGVGGFMKVNSEHHQGLRLEQKAPHVMVSAYSLLRDGIIEAIESTDHSWVTGVQWHPERKGEVPRVFEKLFQKFVSVSGEHQR